MSRNLYFSECIRTNLDQFDTLYNTVWDPFKHTTAGCGHFELQKIPLQKYNDL